MLIGTFMKNFLRLKEGRVLSVLLGLVLVASLISTTITGGWWLEGYFATSVIVSWIVGLIVHGYSEQQNT